MGNLWFALLVGTSLLQSNLVLSDLASEQTEWETFNEMLRNINYRLPTSTRPSRYAVTLTPYFDNPPAGINQFSFDGEVVIYLEATQENVTEIVLQCEDIIINNITLDYLDVNNTLENIAFEENATFECLKPYDFLTLPLSETLDQGLEYILRISFTGNIQDGMRGFYRSWYHDGETRRWMATTQFQPGHARKAFPCYDEPGFKAYFDITIRREADFSPSISNTPIRTTAPIATDGRIAETFYTTPYTSTYLLAFIVSHYKVVEDNNNPQRPFKIYARSNANGTAAWSFDVGERLLATMEAYTQIPYYTMADNLDMKQAAIPDFSAGAMENWGLLTYREALILYDPENSNHFYKQRVANIVSHEIAHMWFGNLVTCAWWDNLWLNEGFARYYQYFLTNEVEPELGYPTRFIVEQLQTALFSDSIDSAHALTNPAVSDPTSVSNHFSHITYARGASILRMTQDLLGKPTYEKGLRRYLADRKFDVADPEHLFEALDRAAQEDGALSAYNGITINRYFKTWSEKAGHPLVTVTVDQATGRMTVYQSRWERTTGYSNQDGLYIIPITWTRGNQVNFDNLKPSKVVTEQVTVIERETTGLEWVIFNKQQSGFYRVNYDDTNWALLTRALRNNAERVNIHEYNRAQIVDDLFAFARSGIMQYEQAFNILSFLEFEDQYAPWLAAISGYEFVIRRVAHDADSFQKMQDDIINLSKAVTARLGFDELATDSYMDGLLRMYVNEFLCNNGHPGCIAAAKEHFASWRAGGYLPPNLRPWVYCVGLREGNQTDFDYFWNHYLEIDLSNDKVAMLNVAGCTTNEASLHKLLDAIVAGDDAVRPQDHNAALQSAIYSNEENPMRAFNWLKANVNQTQETLGSVATPLSYIAARLTSQSDIAEFENWVNLNREFIGESSYNTGINGANSAKSNLEWSGRRLIEITTYLENGYQEVEIDELDPEDGATNAPTMGTPATDAPATDATTTDAPATDAPATDAPEINPPVTNPPPPTTEDPTTEETTTEEPTTEEPTTEQPDSANIAALSLITLIITLSVNFLA